MLAAHAEYEFPEPCGFMAQGSRVVIGHHFCQCTRLRHQVNVRGCDIDTRTQAPLAMPPAVRAVFDSAIFIESPPRL